MITPAVSIRADCGARHGYGHVMRSLTVAQALRSAGAPPRFIMARTSDTAPVEEAGFEVRRLAGDGLGTSEIMALLAPNDGPLLLDTYEVASGDLRTLRDVGFRVALFDDGQRLESYHCDVVIDSAPDAASLPYRGLAETVFCLGSRYFPLRDEFRNGRRDAPARRSVRTIVVSFGGSDHDDVTFQALDALAGIKGDFVVVSVLGPAYAGRAEEAKARDPRVRLMRDVRDMAAVLGAADVALAGSGGTASELAFLGVPMILLALSPDQVPIAEAMERAGAAFYLGRPEDVESATVARALGSLMGDRARRDAMHAAGRALIDGKGAERIAEVILALPRRTVRKTA
jgi:spore coat polysaccharide biosynthesis predicted glycosyltransferase SpsG